MTKKEWYSITEGTKVQTTVTAIGKDKSEPYCYKQTIKGEVKRVNSNGSQALVKWNDGIERWYGRLGLELVQPQQI